MKDMTTKEYYWRIRDVLKLILNAGNTIQAINSRALSIIRYGARILDWRKNKLEAIDRKTRNLLTMYRSLHPRADVDRLYWKRKTVEGVDKCWRVCSDRKNKFRFLPERTRTTFSNRSSK